MARVSVVIPTWNGAQLLRDALTSLAAQTIRDVETIIVDNGSTDDTVALVRREFPASTVVQFDENRGFAAAVNAGIRAASGDVIVLMNNDVEAEPGWLAALVAALERHPEVGACASRMLSYSDRARVDSAGDQLGFFAYSIGHGERNGAEFDAPRYVLSPCAGAAAYRRAVLEQVGLFDERFFAYLEDVDLGVRIQLAGWRCLYVPNAIVYHHGSATAQKLPQTKLYLLMRNSLFLFFQYMPARTMALAAPAMLLWPLYRVVRERQPLRLALRAILDFVRALPAVVGRRRAVRRTRRLSPAEFRTRLSGWPGRSRNGWAAAAPMHVEVER